MRYNKAAISKWGFLLPIKRNIISLRIYLKPKYLFVFVRASSGEADLFYIMAFQYVKQARVETLVFDPYSNVF